MRVAIVAGPHIPVPPPLYGGTERVIAYLVRGLLEAGHEPILLAPGDSQVDFVGVQNYSRLRFGPAGLLPRTENVTGPVSSSCRARWPQPVGRRTSSRGCLSWSPSAAPISTIRGTTAASRSSRARYASLPRDRGRGRLRGYLHWSLMDNWERFKGDVGCFGLLGVDRATQQRWIRPSAALLGGIARANCRGAVSGEATPLVRPSPGGFRDRFLRWPLGTAVRASLLVSPRPAALLVRRVFAAGGATTAEALEKYATAGVEALVDERYGEDPDMLLDVFRPASASGPLPLVLWVHGGGFVGGAKDELAGYFKLVAGSGYVVAGPRYSLGPEHRYPTPPGQMMHALEYLQANAERLRIDPDRIALAGDSAGAHIAAQVGAHVTTPGYADAVGLTPTITPAQLRGLVLACGPYDLGLARETRSPAGRRFIQIVLWAHSGKRHFPDDPPSPPGRSPTRSHLRSRRRSSRSAMPIRSRRTPCSSPRSSARKGSKRRHFSTRTTANHRLATSTSSTLTPTRGNSSSNNTWSHSCASDSGRRRSRKRAPMSTSFLW
jgi:acetyl esterase